MLYYFIAYLIALSPLLIAVFCFTLAVVRQRLLKKYHKYNTKKPRYRSISISAFHIGLIWNYGREIAAKALIIGFAAEDLL